MGKKTAQRQFSMPCALFFNIPQIFRKRRMLRTRVKLLSEGGLSSGSGILVKDSLSGSLIDLLDGNTHSSSLVFGTVGNSSVGLLDLGLQLRVDGFVLHGFGGDHLHALFSRFNVWHKSHLLLERRNYDTTRTAKKQVIF